MAKFRPEHHQASLITRSGKDLHYVPAHPPRTVTLQDFDIGHELGSGRFGTVFIARDKRNNGLVALKQLDIQALVDERMSNQILREIEICQRLNHPNILRMYTYFNDNDHLYLVMEYAVRGDLFKRLAACKTFSLYMTAKLVSQLTDAIEYAHGQNVIHRDIKPENLLLDANKDLKLADFGWSVRDDKPRRTYCGTPDYIPPEMAASKEYDQRVDNWCIGVFAYECLFGKAPFAADSEKERCKKILSLDYSFPEEPKLPAEAYDFIQKLIRVNPNHRMTLKEVQNHPFIVNYYKNAPAEP